MYGILDGILGGEEGVLLPFFIMSTVSRTQKSHIWSANIAPLGPILDSQQNWESGKFQLASWNYKVVLLSANTDPIDPTRQTSQYCLSIFLCGGPPLCVYLVDTPLPRVSVCGSQMFISLSIQCDVCLCQPKHFCCIGRDHWGFKMTCLSVDRWSLEGVIGDSLLLK